MRTLLALATVLGTALAADIDASTPLVEFTGPSNPQGVASCGKASFTWLTRIAPGSPDASALFTLQLVPVASGTRTTAVSIPGQQPTSISVSVSASSTGTPGRRVRRQEEQPVTLRAGLLAMQGAFALQALPAPSGWYVLNGTNVAPSNAAIVFLPSQPFFVSPGSSTTCFTEAASNMPMPAPTTSASDQSGDDDERVHVSSSREHAGIIAGAVVGGFVLTALVLGALFYWRARHKSALDQWRDARTAQWNAFAAPAPSSTGHDHDEKAASVAVTVEDRERDAKAREIAEMLRRAGLREGSKPRAELPQEQYELPGISHVDAHRHDLPNADAMNI